MNLESYNYFLPEELIAQQGAEPRDSSRLMVVQRDSGQTEHRIFRNITEYLRPGDVLVLNESKVIPARLYARKRTGARIETFLVRDLGGNLWEALLRHAHKTHPGTELVFSGGLTATVEGVEEDGTRVLSFSDDVREHLERLGETPLPPYIHASVDLERYQTVYAKTPGSVAAPTAGLHFTPELLECIRAMGVHVSYITLHVGPGTFKPVKGDPDQHRMHAELYEIPAETAEVISRAKVEGRRVVAVGTTVVRTLESAWKGEEVQAGTGETQLFIRPGFHFRVVDALLTNFHLPKSTLLMLVAAFAGYGLTIQAYKTAVENRYRFYSLGDAMLIL